MIGVEHYGVRCARGHAAPAPDRDGLILFVEHVCRADSYGKRCALMPTPGPLRITARMSLVEFTAAWAWFSWPARRGQSTCE